MNANISILVRCCGQLGEFNLSRPTGPEWKPLFSLFLLHRGVTNRGGGSDPSLQYWCLGNREPTWVQRELLGEEVQNVYRIVGQEGDVHI